jgi:hypothetical protein
MQANMSPKSFTVVKMSSPALHFVNGRDDKASEMALFNLSPKENA